MKKFDKPELEILIDMGLTDREALIYIAALETGGGTIADLATTANIERTSIYYHLKKLLELKLLRENIRANRRTYLPLDPNRLKEIKAKNQKEFDNFFPLFEELFAKHGNKSLVEYFQGREEVSKFHDHMHQIVSELKPPNNILYILGTSYRVVTGTNKEFLNFQPKPKQADVIVKAILPAWQKSKNPKENAMDPYIVTRYNLPKATIKYISDKYKYPGAVVVTADRIALYDYRNMIYSITLNKNLAQTWRMLFEFVWNNLK